MRGPLRSSCDDRQVTLSIDVRATLAVLRRAGLLTSSRQGRYVRYALDGAATGAIGRDPIAALLR